MGCVLGQHDERGRKESALYYQSKKLTDYESRYSTLEKTCLALVWATQRLRHYPAGLFRSPVGKDGSDEISL
jgi:hypothetical protein